MPIQPLQKMMQYSLFYFQCYRPLNNDPQLNLEESFRTRPGDKKEEVEGNDKDVLTSAQEESKREIKSQPVADKTKVSQ